MLNGDPKVDPNKFYDYEAAKAEGWFIAWSSGSEDGDGWQIQYDQETNIIKGDKEAHHFVMKKCREGSWNHVNAIVFIMTHEPFEYTQVLLNWFMVEYDKELRHE